MAHIPKGVSESTLAQVRTAAIELPTEAWVQSRVDYCYVTNNNKTEQKFAPNCTKKRDKV